MASTPFPKALQLRRGERRYRREIASPKQWQALWQEKGGPCRVCTKHGSVIQLHHLVSRAHGGDDVAENLVPVCPLCHEALHRRAPAIGRLLLSRLSDAEYAYMVDRGGEDIAERVYGVEYVRQS